jgi:hypothetical protein
MFGVHRVSKMQSENFVVQDFLCLSPARLAGGYKTRDDSAQSKAGNFTAALGVEVNERFESQISVRLFIWPQQKWRNCMALCLSCYE